MTSKELKNWFPDIRNSIGDVVPAFPTKKAATKHAVSIGWPTWQVMKIEFPLVCAWVVAQKLDNMKALAGYEDLIIFPLEKIERNKRVCLTIRMPLIGILK